MMLHKQSLIKDSYLQELELQWDRNYHIILIASRYRALADL